MKINHIKSKIKNNALHIVKKANIKSNPKFTINY